MELKELIKQARKLSEPYRVTKGKHFNLKDFDPSDSGDLEREDKPRAVEALTMGGEALCELQERLYAQDRWALLLVFQAIDAAGKDSAIKHVMSGINPQGCQVFTFKQPSKEDLDHDYLWRCLKVMPERGRIGIFNRSYYEELVVVRGRLPGRLQEAIRGTASDTAPWYVVPADHKWFTRIVVAGAVIDALAGMDLDYPTVTAEGKRDLAIGRKELLGT